MMPEVPIESIKTITTPDFLDPLFHKSQPLPRQFYPKGWNQSLQDHYSNTSQDVRSLINQVNLLSEQLNALQGVVALIPPENN